MIVATVFWDQHVVLLRRDAGATHEAYSLFLAGEMSFHIRLWTKRIVQGLLTQVIPSPCYSGPHLVHCGVLFCHAIRFVSSKSQDPNYPPFP